MSDDTQPDFIIIGEDGESFIAARSKDGAYEKIGQVLDVDQCKILVACANIGVWRH